LYEASILTLTIFLITNASTSSTFTLSLHDALPIFQYSGQTDDFESLTPVTTGNYSISYIAIGSSFKDHEALFRTFERNRQPISQDRKSTRLNSSHVKISYAVFCLKKKKRTGFCTQT